MSCKKSKTVVPQIMFDFLNYGLVQLTLSEILLKGATH